MYKAKYILTLCTYIIMVIPLYNWNIDLPDIVYEQEFEFVRNKIIIPVEVQAREYRFILDTGATNLFSTDLAKEIEYSILSNQDVSDANNVTYPLSLISLEGMRISDYSPGTQKGFIVDFLTNKALSCFRIDGIVGSDFFRNRILQIDFQSKMIRVASNRKDLGLKRKMGLDMYVDPQQNSPVIWIEIGNKNKSRDQVLIDSGMDGFYAMSVKSSGVFKSNGIVEIIDSSSGRSTVGLFGDGEPVRQNRFMAQDMNLGDIKFSQVIGETTIDNNSRIGVDLLQYGRVSFDWINGKFYFDLMKSVEDYEAFTWPMSPTIKGDHFLAGTIWDDSLDQTISIGDTIIAIDGTYVTSENLCSFIYRESLFSERDSLLFVIKDAVGQKHELMIHKQKYTRK